MRDIFFTGLGACQEVGRSSLLVDAGDKILLDRGVKLTPHGVEYPLPVEINLDAAIISHAHLDHSGHLPKLFMESNCLSYMTPPTLDIARILWFDTLKIADAEALEAEFTEDEIRQAERYTFSVEYGRKLDITKNVSMEFFDAGHIVGSALTKLSFSNGKSFLYTGDYRVDEMRLHAGADVAGVGKADFVVTESTYGDREHSPRKETEKAFVEGVIDVVNHGGWAVVPAFAVGRSQEIIDVLAEYNVAVPVFLDGMCQTVSRVYLRHAEYLKEHKALEKALHKATWIKNDSWRKRVFKQPSVVVTTAGMMQGGPVYQYLPKMINDENSKIFLTGYQVEETPGRILLETGRIPIDGELVEAVCKVEKFDFSAHPSQSEMLKALKKWSPQKVLLVHGDKKVMPVFKEKIESELGIEAIIPELGRKICLTG
ncbi:MAG: MBL fold metallo-hydrolase [Candidatus Diapherotrites archaeon]|nr:MBL fold metallo-hydrolase [Candidatus Diapherotrites archaeon]